MTETALLTAADAELLDALLGAEQVVELEVVHRPDGTRIRHGSTFDYGVASAIRINQIQQIAHAADDRLAIWSLRNRAFATRGRTDPEAALSALPSSLVLQISPYVTKPERFDLIVRDFAPDRLLAASRTGVGRYATGLDVQLTKFGVALTYDQHLVALVNATRVKFSDPPKTFEADFLAEDHPWMRVQTELRRRVPMAFAASRVSDRADLRDDATVLPKLLVLTRPVGQGRRIVGEMVRATHRVRNDRSVVIGHRVRVDRPGWSLELAPPRTVGKALEVPFTFRAGGGPVEGGLRLKSPADPLACVIRVAPVAKREARCTRAWVAALLVFAELSCVAESASPESQTRAHRRRERSPSGPAARRARTVTSGAELFRSGQGGLVPDGDTRRILNAYVVGHRRRLLPGRRAGDQALENARRWGITLRPGFTWVEPHVRGAPSGVVLRFSWPAPPVEF